MWYEIAVILTGLLQVKQKLFWKFSCLYTAQSIRPPKIILLIWTTQAIQGLQNPVICLQKYSLKQWSLKWTLTPFSHVFHLFCTVSEKKALPEAETRAWFPWLTVVGVCVQQQFCYGWSSIMKTHNCVQHKGTEPDTEPSPKLCSYYSAANLIAEPNFFMRDTVFMGILL